MSEHHLIEQAALEALKRPSILSDYMDKSQRFSLALKTIAEMPIPEQDNMIAANMRLIAKEALKP